MHKDNFSPTLYRDGLVVFDSFLCILTIAWHQAGEV